MSPACAHCYADSAAKRFGNPGLWEVGGRRRFFGDSHWDGPLRWNRKAEKEGKPRLIFCASMSDVFELHPDPETNATMDAERERLWELIEQTPWLTWQLLTKRPENVMSMVPWQFVFPPNVWVGTSIENSAFTWRAEALRAIPTVCRFLSCEPLLGSLFHVPMAKRPKRMPLGMAGIGWVIGGGESGPQHRPTQLVWAKELLIASKHRGIPFFWKQNGGARPKSNGKAIEGEEFCEVPSPFMPDLALV